MTEQTEQALATTADNKPAVKTPDYRETLKYKQWVQYYFDKKNKETYGNATKSAMKAYNAKSYNSAASIGHENLKKVENLLTKAAEEVGLTAPALLERLSKAAQTYEEIKDLIAFVGLAVLPANQPGNTQQQPSINLNIQNFGQLIKADRQKRGLE